jgi:Cu(I)/Ag(I) efflux system protein CusF
MKIIQSILTISALLLATTPAFAGSHASAPIEKDAGKAEAVVPSRTPSASANMADGEVRKVDKENKKMTIKHGEIKNLDMPPMSMVFQVRDPALLDKIKPGDKIRFSAEKLESAFVVTAIELKN